MLFLLCSLFFFKHKTTYEMRISDWSSDVCSSDRADRGRTHRRQRRTDAAGAAFAWQSGRGFRALEVERGHPSPPRSRPAAAGGVGICRHASGRSFGGSHRSEEHTSELQSLMRISYAVFCLKKKTYMMTIYQDICNKSV